MKLNGDYLENMAQLEQYDCYSWGENILLVKEENGDRYLVNNITGKARQISTPGYVVGFSDDEIDFETIEKLPHGHKARARIMNYGSVHWWDRCQNGLIALCWTLYPDGRYFADGDGYGMEDNDEEEVYCVMNDNLEVVRPFTVVPDIRALLAQLRQEKNDINVEAD